MKLLLPIVGAAVAALCSLPAQAQPLTRDDLAQALKQRDEVIAALQARIVALEQQQASRATQSAAAPSAESLTVSGGPVMGGKVAASASAEDDDATMQALSRSLVERGGLVLAPWRMELIPSVAYSNRVVQGLALVETPEGIPTVADQRLRQDKLRATMAMRLGLPWSNQLEVRLPYNWLRTSRALGDGTSATNEGSGIGDVEVAISHQFLHETGGRPALVGGLSWRFSTGQDPFQARVASVATGAGADEVRGRLTVLKSSDPLVFFGTFSYAHDLPLHESFGTVQLGDAIGVDLGMVLALNPETSMTFAVSQEFGRRTRVDHEPLNGTDTVSSVLDLGLSRLLTRNLLLDVSLGVGLSHDAPDYVVQFALPFRFR